MRRIHPRTVAAAVFGLGVVIAWPAVTQDTSTTQDTSIKGFVVDAKGNLGVGTSAPEHMLHVAEDAYIGGIIMGGGLGGTQGWAGHTESAGA